VCESSFSFSTNSTQQEYQSLRSMYKVQRVSWKDLCQIIPLSLETESASHHSSIFGNWKCFTSCLRLK
jgi:hypothetical protein